MSCFRALDAWRDYSRRTKNGKAAVVFSPPSGLSEAIKVPCGQCIGCRLDRSRDWALRCMHEASLHEENCFITLTYDEDHVPARGSLVKSDHQKFLKRLRSHFENQRIRYFLCGEYGESMLRPHYHALLFGLDFWDKLEWSKGTNGDPVYRSYTLEELWPFGFSSIGALTWQSAAYVARYVIKKVNGDLAYERYARGVDESTGEIKMIEPEYIAMSRRPGIGKGWYERYKKDCEKDFVTHEGKVYSVPDFYDRQLEMHDEDAFKAIKAKRKEVAKRKAVERKRLRELETCQELRAKKLKRSI